jgi:tetratricopeptide (TPR) repeat protein
MVPAAVVLFYFWQTQKPIHDTPFRETILERLRAPEITMGLKGRNILFFCASILLISAMAQPVILQKNLASEGHVEAVIALDLSKKPIEYFETEKIDAINAVHILEGQNISLIGYDKEIYRISPASTDSAMMVELIQGLDPEVMHFVGSNVKKLSSLRGNETLKIIIGDPIREHNTPPSTLKEKVDKIKLSQHLYAHSPLFLYPLGLAMLLIAIALSSMSKRHSIPVLGVLAMLCLSGTPSVAGVLDFQDLREGYRAYEKGNYTHSAECFSRYQKKHDSPEIRYNLGNVYYKVGEYEKARYWYARVHTSKSRLAEQTAYNLAQTYQKLKEHEKVKGIKSENSEEHTPTCSSQKRIKSVKEKRKTRLYSM